MFGRALVRGGIEPVYSQGYNPHPRMSLPLPRPVGVEAEDDLFCVLMRGVVEGFDEEGFKSKLGSQLPAGCEVVSVRAVKGKVSLQPIEATYVFKIKAEAIRHGLTQGGGEIRHGLTRINTENKEEEKKEVGHGFTQGEGEIRHGLTPDKDIRGQTQINTVEKELKKRIEEILASERLEVERRINHKDDWIPACARTGGRTRVLDVRSYIEEIELKEGRVEVKCNISAAGSIRVEEILRLLGLEIENLELPIVRRNVKWEGLEEIKN